MSKNCWMSGKQFRPWSDTACCSTWPGSLFVLRFYGPVNPMGSCLARSVYLTTHLLGRLSPLKRLTSIVHILSPETDNCPSWISVRERMTVENISWSISTKECCRPRWPGSKQFALAYLPILRMKSLIIHWNLLLIPVVRVDRSHSSLQYRDIIFIADSAKCILILCSFTGLPQLLTTLLLKIQQLNLKTLPVGYLKPAGWVANIIDPNQMLHSAASD